ncbi:pressure-regulated protein [Microbulbifer agarilyticus]|uniref:Pressure-regulated protein n=1 Tax=Microbulbifer agarilyticus TaxID=260552 RepID=A0A1Q2M1H3_9GAMM|nr:DUF3565 domain-containing protein [Microbulbifer agarilyticus]AQQ66378.1 pressure-regulated protein [Microbulbifer agarilyticus]
MQQPITGYHRDNEDHWVAQLACGHNQHVRHDPPWQNRPWVTTPEGRAEMLGFKLQCKKCDEGAPLDEQPPSQSRESN